MFGKGALFRPKCEEAAGVLIRKELSGHSESKGKYESINLIETLQCCLLTETLSHFF